MGDPNYTTWLYICGVKGGPTKIGHSGAPTRRFKQIEARAGEKIVVTGTWPVGKAKALAAERYVHWLLRHHHIAGEWFDAPRDVILDAIYRSLSTPMSCDPIPPLDSGGRRSGEAIPTSFPKGTKARLRALVGDTGHADFIRAAVESELSRREGAANVGN